MRIDLEGVGLRAVAYMAESMGMRDSDEDQDQNFILGHLHTFAHQEIVRAASLAPVAPTWTQTDAYVGTPLAPVAGADLGCEWNEDADGVSQTACGRTFALDDSSGAIENGLRFCHFCGKRIRLMSSAVAAPSRVAPPWNWPPPQVDLPEWAAKVLRDNLWQLYDDGPSVAPLPRAQTDEDLPSAADVLGILPCATEPEAETPSEKNRRERRGSALIALGHLLAVALVPYKGDRPSEEDLNAAYRKVEACISELEGEANVLARASSAPPVGRPSQDAVMFDLRAALVELQSAAWSRSWKRVKAARKAVEAITGFTVPGPLVHSQEAPASGPSDERIEP